MDDLRRDDLERARRDAPGDKLLQALDLMAAGFAIQRRKLRAAHPAATEAELDELLLAWKLREPS